MSDKTPESQPQSEPRPQPEGGPSRHQVQWGRMPSQVFRAGPLPRGPSVVQSQPRSAAPAVGATVTPAPTSAPESFTPGGSGQPVARPAATGRGGIYSGSLIPRARPDAATGSLPPVAPRPTPQPASQPIENPPEHAARQALATARLASEPVVAPAPARVDTTVRPLPEAAAPAVSPFDPLPEPFAAIPEAAANPNPVPTPALSRATGKTGSSRLPLYVGAGVVVIAGVAAAVWFLRPQPAAAPASTSPVVVTEAAPALTPPVESAPIATPEPVPSAPATTAPVAASVSAPARPTTSAPAQTRPAAAATSTRPAAQVPTPTATRTPVPAQTPAAPPPQIVVAPIVVAPAAPPPTAARPQTTDPDAPMSTRPQPLD